jgi:protocatechuate 3,4-dioxygenase beta subunit
MLKRLVTSVFLISLFLITPLSAQKVYLKGRVVDNNNSPVQGAQVELVKANKTQTTDSDGRYSIETVLVSVLKTSMASDMITFQNGILSFKMSGVQKPVLSMSLMLRVKR